MRKSVTFLLSVLFIALSFNAEAQSDTDYFQKLEDSAVVEEMVMVPMRDGVRLATHIYRPKTDKPVPIIFSRHPYNINRWVKSGEKKKFGGVPQIVAEKNMGLARAAYEAVQRGYAYVVQNERGRYFSEGEWQILGYPLTDASDMYEWMREREWSNGKIGLWGCSSSAEWQLAAASIDNAADAMVPMGYGAGVGTVGEYHEQGNWYRGGVFQTLFASWLYSVEQDENRPRPPKGASREDLQRIARYYDLQPMSPPVNWTDAYRHLPLKDILNNLHGKKHIFNDMITRKPDDPAWYEGGLYHDTMDFNVPSFWFVSWYDIAVSPNLAVFNHVRNTASDPEVRENQYMVIAPTLHCDFSGQKKTVVGERNMGDTRWKHETKEIIYDWFDLWLKEGENEFKKQNPRVRYYTMGSNEWQSAETWPPQNTEEVTFYLESGGNANSLHGDGTLQMEQPGSNDQPDQFVYDPMNPVPTHGGGFCCAGEAAEPGSRDQRKVEARNDVLVYTSEPLEEGVEVTGFIETTLYVSSDARDTDFTVKLVDVYPDGTAYNLKNTIQRARYREGYDKEVFMEDGEVYEIGLTPMATSNYFKEGHRIRIEISSSNFPRFARNLNTGGDTYDEKEGVVARNEIHHSSKYPSKITFSVKTGSLPIQVK